MSQDLFSELLYLILSYNKQYCYPHYIDVEINAQR